MNAAYVLRLGAAFCFIGHGAFGFITKAAWVPYFAVAGIPEAWAWRLMPLIGALDVLAGMAVLFAPRRLALLYMVGWGLWTAALRPLAGESVFEMIERAGNYGVPLAFLMLAGWPRRPDWRALTEPVWQLQPGAVTVARVQLVLRWTTCLLLAGHGALGVSGKALLTEHYLAVGLAPSLTPAIGWFELGLAAAVAVRPAAALLLFVLAWKLLTESLFLVAGAPIWEFVERAGSYAAPLGLLLCSFGMISQNASGNAVTQPPKYAGNSAAGLRKSGAGA